MSSNPPDLDLPLAASPHKFRRAVVRYSLSLASLAIPAVLTFTLKLHPGFNPVISLSYVLAIAAAAWWGGLWAGILVSCATIPIFMLAVSGGKQILPPRLDPVAMMVFFFISALVSGIAKVRRRIEAVLRSANEELEDKVRERTIELEHARKWLEITLASIGDAVIATDKNGNVTFLNGVAETLTGWSQTGASGRPLTDIFVIVNETTRELVEDPVAKVFRTGAITGLANHTVLISKNGNEIAIDDSAAPIRDEQNEVAGVVLIFRDVTERRRSEHAAEQARLTLERTNQELQQFAYAASHDLREPLRNVRIYSQLLAERYRGKLDRDADQFISFAVNGALRMEVLLRDLLAYTQASSMVDKEIKLTDVNIAIQNVLSNLQTTISENGACITYDALPTLCMNEVHVEQILQNLIGNAIKYRAELPPKIHISAHRNGSEWTLRVTDNGIGIDPQYRQQIFGLFKRLHTAAEYPGTGIGLALCQKIVQRYGGRIWVESEAGRGSAFCFTAPIENHPLPRIS